MLPEVPWFSPELFIHRQAAMIPRRFSCSSLLICVSCSAWPWSTWVEWRLAREPTADLFRHHPRRDADRGRRGACNVRRERDIIELPERRLGRRRLLPERFEHGAAHVPALERPVELVVVH